MSRKWSLEIIFIIHFITELFFLHHLKIYLTLQIELHKSVLFMFYPLVGQEFIGIIRTCTWNGNRREEFVPVLEVVIDDKNPYLYLKY